MVDFDLSLTELNEIQNHDDFIIVWMSSDDLTNELKNFPDYLKDFRSNEKSIDYINQVKSESKILLVLTDFKSLSNFENFIQIQSIYIFQKKKENIKFNKENHRKLVDIFNDMNQLINRLRKDILLTYRNDLSINISSIKEITIEQSLINLQGNTLMFMWNQLFFYYLIKSPNVNMEKLKKDMLEQCRLEYQDNQIALDKIDDFEKEFSYKDVLEWYSKDSFVYRLLNKAFRTRNIELICKFQYFIILLYQKFKELSKEQQNNNPSIVYRGQILNKNTIENLKSNIGNLISINTFMSTSRDEKVARGFILGAENVVIFKINIETQISNSFKPFIDISKFSSMPEEKEILFFLGTIFSIISVKSEDNSTHIIELTLHNDTSILIENLISDFQKSLYHLDNLHHLFMKTDDFRMINNYYFILTNERFLLNNSTSLIMYIYLAFIFSNLGLYEKAIQLYKQSISINRISMKSPQSIVLHLIIGYLYYHLSDYNNAFIYYRIVLSLIDQTNLLTGELYNHIGDVWYKIANDDIALSCYKEALIIANHQDIPSLPNIYRNLIDILEKKGNFDEAFVYKEKAKEIDQSQYHLEISTLDTPASLEYLKNQLNQNANPPSIQRIDFLYQSGLRLMKDGDFDQALTTLLEAKELILKEPPSWHRFPQLLSTLFDNIALLYLFRYDFLKALVMWKKSIDISNNFYSH